MIGIIGAMDIEVESLKRLLKNVRVEKISNIEFFCGIIGETDIHRAFGRHAITTQVGDTLGRAAEIGSLGTGDGHEGILVKAPFSSIVDRTRQRIVSDRRLLVFANLSIIDHLIAIGFHTIKTRMGVRALSRQTEANQGALGSAAAFKFHFLFYQRTREIKHETISQTIVEPTLILNDAFELA